MLRMYSESLAQPEPRLCFGDRFRAGFFKVVARRAKRNLGGQINAPPPR